MQEENKNILIVSAHFDDECNCWSFIKDDKHLHLWFSFDYDQYNLNKNIDIHNAHKMNTDPRHSTQYSGIFNDQEFDNYPIKAFINRISGMLKDNPQIDTILIPDSNSGNKDHQIITEAAMVAARPHKSNVKNIIQYETLGTETFQEKPFQPNLFKQIDIDEKFEWIDKFYSHKLSTKTPMCKEGFKLLARYRGMQACGNFNTTFNEYEAFKIIRSVDIL